MVCEYDTCRLFPDFVKFVCSEMYISEYDTCKLFPDFVKFVCSEMYISG